MKRKVWFEIEYIGNDKCVHVEDKQALSYINQNQR